MKYLVGFDGGPAAKRALELACQQAAASKAKVYVVSSMEGGSGENLNDIRTVEKNLQWAKDQMLNKQIQCETVHLARGLSPGEDLVQFAKDNGVDLIFLGIEKKSRAQKILLGSTAQYVILRGPCPVTTIK